MRTLVRVNVFAILLLFLAASLSYVAITAAGISTADYGLAPEANERPRISVQPGIPLAERSKVEFFQKVIAQTNLKPNPRSDSTLFEEPDPCETAATYLDLAVVDTRSKNGSYLILIARLGTGEKSRRLNRQRLAVVQEYVLRRGSDLKYVLAEGSRVKGLGRIEVYVEGRLYRILRLEKNSPTYCNPGREGN